MIKKPINTQSFAKELADALAPLEEKYGIIIRPGRCLDAGSRLVYKLHCLLPDADKEFLDFAKICMQFGLLPEHFNRPFTHGGKTYMLTGLRDVPGAQCRCVCIEPDDTEEIYLSISTIRCKHSMRP